MPATFMYSKALEKASITINFETRDDLQWKVATQLKPVSNTTFWAPNLQYFMDSPTEISNFSMRSFDVDGKTIRFALHHNGTEAEVDEYFTSVKKIVLEQKEVYGELPNFDFDTYTFLACYLPHVNGDGMEHRNSTILTSTRGLAQGGMQGNLGTVSHEFFHAWNVERIRPQSLEPFDFSKANMSGELWFAEGFTSYYTNLILCRAGLITPERYIKGLTGTFNYVWNSPGRQFFNPIQMSYQAPFVDAATSLDPVNRNNTFISYYSYGSVLGLALDLSLREKGLNLDDYMKLVWNTYGKNETPYTIKNLQDALANYASPEFAENFFSNYIYKSKMPDYKRLLQNMGVSLSQINTSGYLGVFFNKNKVSGNATINSPAYNAGLERGATIKKINDIEITKDSNINSILKDFKEGDTLTIIFDQLGKEKTTTVTLAKNPSYTISVNEKASQQQLINRDKWLN
jgi:predicted metalloprotease with PDZ domain